MRSLTLFCFCATILTNAATLFDGTSLRHWTPEGPHPAFEISNGELVITGRGNQPNWLHTVQEYEDFRLHFEYKLAQWGEAAVILRAPRLGRPAQAGISLYLAHDYHKHAEKYATGAIAGVRPALAPMAVSFNQWHSVDISTVGDHLKASIDGIEVQDVRLNADPELRHRLRRGFIGFPDTGYKYWLRNIQLEDLKGTTAFVDFVDTTGWTLRGSGQWHLKDGVLHAWGGDGVYYAPGEFTDFELTLLVRPHDRVNSGVFLRGSADPKQSRGFEVQLYSPLDSVYPTGSIYNHVRSKITADFEDRWFLLQITVQGTHCLVRLDGDTVAESQDLPETALPKGSIGLQFHSADGSIEFRDLRVRPLN